MKWLYKYPQRAYPYTQLIEENRRRQAEAAPEYELLDTGVFDDDRYFDVLVEYAKDGPEDLAIRITATNRGPEAAPLHVLPHLWFRNTWAWGAERAAEPVIRPGPDGAGCPSLLPDERGAQALRNLPFPYRVGTRHLYYDKGGQALFTDNETNYERLMGADARNRKPYVKDAFHRRVVGGETAAVNPAGEGTKSCVWFEALVPAGGSVTYRLRLSTDL